MPGDTASPVKLRSGRLLPAGPTSIFIELRLDQRFERVQRGRRVGADRAQLDGGAGSGGEHHQPHDRAAGDFFAGAFLVGAFQAHDRNRGGEALDGLDEFGRGTRMQASPIRDLNPPDRVRSCRLIGRAEESSHSAQGSPARSRDATAMYFRPASCALVTAFSSVSLERRLASLISIGRLTPAMTSTLALSMIEMARLEGVPPNMSVSTTTPWPSSTLATLSRMSWRRFSISSSGQMQTAMQFFCGPTTCSSASTNSAASRPWVTSTRPIIACPRSASVPYGVSRLARWTSRCETPALKPWAPSQAASRSATKTDRWRPPVQPIPIVR